MAQYQINKYAYALNLELTFTLISQNTTNNTSVVRVLGRVVGTGNGEGAWGGAGRTGTITFNGVTESFNTGKDYNFPNATAVNFVLFQKNYTVAHNTDGTKSVSGSITWKHDNAYFNSNAGTNTASVSITNQALTTIPRYANITAFTASINDRSATMSWTADKTISQLRWSTNSGSSYTEWKTVNATSGSMSVSVSPGSTYGFRIQVINSASGLITTSSVVSKTATKTPSTLTLSTTSQNVGSNITWTVKESYDYTHKITYAFGNTSGYILGSGSAASNNATGTWTVPTALANQIPNATSGVGTIYVYTYYGSTHIGTKTYSFTAKVPNNATFQPTATISSIVQGVALPTGITVYVQNKSKAKVTSTGTGKYGSTIKTYSVSVAGIGTYTGSVITSDFLKNSGTVRVTLTVTDSRGLKGSTYQDINVVAYSPPKISTFNAARSESTPTNISISYNASISSVSSQNGVHYRIRSLPSGGSWVVNRNVTTGYTSSESFSITSDSNKTYTIEIYVADKWTSVTRTVQIGTGFTLMDFHESGRAMAIGKVSEDNYFEVGMPTTIFTDEPNILTLKRSHPQESNVNVNLVFENDFQTRYMTFKATGRPAWGDDPDVNAKGYNFWTEENLSSSSREIKKDIENTNHQENYEVYKGLKVYDYNLKDEFDEKKTREKDHIGLITDEVPDFLTDKDQTYIKVYDLLSLTVSTLQTTIKKVETLELKVKDLENEIEKLKSGNQID